MSNEEQKYFERLISIRRICKLRCMNSYEKAFGVFPSKIRLLFSKLTLYISSIKEAISDRFNTLPSEIITFFSFF